MDAQAHLIALGWAGPGHALDSRPQYKQKGHRGLAYNPALDPLKVGNTGNGLVKPLSISKRKDRFGIGKRAHEPASGTEWWLKGFENALGNIGKSESERSGTSTPTLMGQRGKHAGLYGFFIEGQIMEGTITEDLFLEKNRHDRKRKSDALNEAEDGKSGADGKRVKITRTTGLEVSPVRRKPETVLDFATVGAFIRERDRSAKKRNSTEVKKSETDQFAQIGKFFEESEKSESKKKKKKQSSEPVVDCKPMDEISEQDTKGLTETKEERRARRRKRKEEKERGVRLKVGGRTHGIASSNVSEDEETKVARKAEKRRRRAEREVQNGRS